MPLQTGSPNVPLVERRHRAACHLLLFAYQDSASILHRHGSLQRILNFIQRQPGMSDRCWR